MLIFGFLSKFPISTTHKAQMKTQKFSLCFGLCEFSDTVPLWIIYFYVSFEYMRLQKSRFEEGPNLWWGRPAHLFSKETCCLRRSSPHWYIFLLVLLSLFFSTFGGRGADWTRPGRRQQPLTPTGSAWSTRTTKASRILPRTCTTSTLSSSWNLSSISFSENRKQLIYKKTFPGLRSFVQNTFWESKLKELSHCWPSWMATHWPGMSSFVRAK